MKPERLAPYTFKSNIAKFIVDQKRDGKSNTQYCLEIMKKMRDRASSDLALHGIGKENVAVCKEICVNLGKWIAVTEIETEGT